MKNKWCAIWTWLKQPPLWWLVLSWCLTACTIVGAMLMLIIDYAGTPLAYLAYTLFALAALTLSYTVYTLVRFLPRAKRSLAAWVRHHAFTRELTEDFGYRTVVFSIVSFGISMAYGVFNGVLGILSRSIWYGALATYYILLALLRGWILLHHVKSGRAGDGESARATVVLRRAKTYRACGMLLLLLQVALSAAIVQMIFDDKGFSYDWGWMIFAVAAYAFYKIIFAAINFFKAHKQEDLSVRAIRNVNLADAMVSILALQTALLGVYGTQDLSVSNFNTVTGAAVSLFTFGLGVFMIVKAQKRIKKLKTESSNGE